VGSQLWERSATHREFWRERISNELEAAATDPHSPWFDRELPQDQQVLADLADLVGLVAWYLGLQVDEPYPSLDDVYGRANVSTTVGDPWLTDDYPDG